MSAIRLMIVAATVVLSACGGAGTTTAGTGSDAQGDASAVTVTAGDLFYEPQQLSTAPGAVTITLDNQGAVAHDVVIEEAGDRPVAEAPPGESATGSIALDAGTYTFYCAVPGHRAAGMEGTLTVE